MNGKNHGGDIYGLEEACRENRTGSGVPPGEEPLDFSANLNPLGIPCPVRRAMKEAIDRPAAYPDIRCRALIRALSEREKVPPEKIVCGAGAADLIYRLVQGLKPKKAAVTAPSFSEYEAALSERGCVTEHHFLLPETGFAMTEALLADAEQRGKQWEILFLCNPNNPTGRQADIRLLRRLLEICLRNNTLVVADECFQEFLEKQERCSVQPWLDTFENLLVLKAFTKTFALAGVRLGYALSSNRPLLDRIRQTGQPWSVSTVAQAAGIQAAEEEDHLERTRVLLKEERPFLVRGLETLGFSVISSGANFIFFRDPKKRPLAEKLLERRILIRDCSDYKGLEEGYYRICIRTRAENSRLLRAMEEVCRAGRPEKKRSQSGADRKPRQKKPQKAETPQREDGLTAAAEEKKTPGGGQAGETDGKTKEGSWQKQS